VTVHLYGGFGEKGGLCLGLRSGGHGLLIDAGVHTGAGSQRYPGISPEELASYQALILTHGHEDHVAALGWIREQGFSGPVWLTEETRLDTLDIAERYAEPHHRPWIAQAPFRILDVGSPFSVGPFQVTTGRSGHAVGGVWCLVTAEGQRLLYCGDVVPHSTLLTMDPLPPCDAMVLDASYADDPSSLRLQQDRIRQWLADHPGGAVLPTPLTGRSLELLALVEEVAIAGSMRDSLARQLAPSPWLGPGVAGLPARLARAVDWAPGQPLPTVPLLCDDGMGQRGPSAAALEAAAAQGRPILLTGHLPRGSLAETLYQQGRAAWIRFPTHPTLAENVALVEATGPALVLGHSCSPEGLDRLAAHLPLLDATARNRGVYNLDPTRPATPGCNLRPIAPGLYRGDGPTGLSPDGRSRLDALGLAAVIDLRSPVERQEAPCDWDGAPGVQYHAVDLSGGLRRRPGGQLGTDLPTLAHLYVALLDRCTPELATIFRLMLQAPGPVLFHCSAGKDRTGVVALLALGLLGASESQIQADYLATRAAIGPLLPFLAAGPSIRAQGPRGYRFLHTDPAFLEAALDWIRHAGGFEGYATKNLGLDPGEISEFRRRYGSLTSTERL